MTTAFCTNCGATLGGGRFCTTCGTPAAGFASEAAVDTTAPVASDETVAANEGVETELIPRSPQPVPGALPPLSTLPPPLMGLPPLRSTLPPVPQPKTKKSPLPWIAAGAVLALASGGVTAWLIVGRTHHTATPVPTVGATSAGASSAGATSAVSTPLASATRTDAEVAQAQRAIIEREVAAHQQFARSIRDVDDMCHVQVAGHPYHATPYDSAAMIALVGQLRDFVRTRQSTIADMRALIPGSSAEAAAMSQRWVAEWTSLTPLATDIANWAAAGQSRAAGSCTLDAADQIPGDNVQKQTERAKRRQAVWQQWSLWAARQGVDVLALSNRLVDPVAASPAPPPDVSLL